MSHKAQPNTLQDTALVPVKDRDAQPNLLDETMRDQASGFVVYSSKVATLSVRVAILIPTLTAALWLAMLFLTKLAVTGLVPPDKNHATDPEGGVLVQAVHAPARYTLFSPSCLCFLRIYLTILTNSKQS